MDHAALRAILQWKQRFTCFTGGTSEFGSGKQDFSKIGYSSSLIYNILRPHLPVRPGCIDVPRLDKKQKRRFEKAKLDKIEMYAGNFNGTHVICVVELGKHNEIMLSA